MTFHHCVQVRAIIIRTSVPAFIVCGGGCPSAHSFCPQVSQKKIVAAQAPRSSCMRGHAKTADTFLVYARTHARSLARMHARWHTHARSLILYMEYAGFERRLPHPV